MLCAVFWSTSGLFIQFIDWSAPVIAGSRSFLSIIVLFPLRRYLNVKQEPIKLFSSITGGVFYSATMITFVFANQLTSPANAILLQFTAPIWAALLGWVLVKERPFWENWVALIIITPGMFMILSDGLGGGAFIGNLLGLASGVVFAMNSIVLRKRRDASPLDVMIGAHIFTLLFSIPFFFISPPQFTTLSVLSVVYMGTLQVGLPSALFVYGVKRVTAVQSMLTASIEPVLNPIWVMLVLGLMPTPIVIAGGGFILGAVLFSGFVTNWRSKARAGNAGR